MNEGDLPEGRVTTVEARGRAPAITRFEGQFAALGERCVAVSPVLPEATRGGRAVPAGA